MRSPYDTLAHYYDLVHKTLVDDLAFVADMARSSGGAVLELGCGTGRLALHLAAQGHDVIGVDNSVEMLSIAQAKLDGQPEAVRKRINLVEADMVSYDIPCLVNLIIVSYNTFLHLLPSDRHRTLSRVRQSLARSGVLVLDLPNPLELTAGIDEGVCVLERVLEEPSSGDTLMQFSVSRLFAAEQRLSVTWIFDRVAAADGGIHRLVSQFDYHYLFPHEVAILLENAGLKLDGLYGDYERRMYREESERMLAVARA